LDFITAHPARWLTLLGRKLLLLVNATEMLDTESQESYAEWSWPLRFLGWFGHFGVLVPLAVLGMFLSWPDRRRLGILYALTAVYTVSVLLFYVFARYRLPLVALFMLFAAAALCRIPAFVAALRRVRGSAAAPRDSGLHVSAIAAASAAIACVTAVVV